MDSRAGGAGVRGTARALRITHVLATAEFAGTERYVVDVATELGRRGHDVAVIGGARPAMHTRLPAGVRWSPASTLADAAAALSIGGRRDIVHSHITRADFAALAAAPFAGGRRVSTRHITVRRGYTPAARRFAVAVRAMLACEVAVSQFVTDALERRADVVLLNGARPVDAAVEGREPVVALAQRLVPDKDTATALRAWACSGLGRHGWRLVVAGDGSERTAAERLAVELGIAASCRFVGWLDDPRELLRTASLLLAPAPCEPCGLTVLEAMAHGTPVVAAASGGHLETVGQEPSAAMFPPGDAAAAASHLVRLAGDEDARVAYGRALQRLQRERFTLAAHVDELEVLYRALLVG